jgi:hypothetical protein
MTWEELVAGRSTMNYEALRQGAEHALQNLTEDNWSKIQNKIVTVLSQGVPHSAGRLKEYWAPAQDVVRLLKSYSGCGDACVSAAVVCATYERRLQVGIWPPNQTHKTPVAILLRMDPKQVRHAFACDGGKAKEATKGTKGAGNDSKAAKSPSKGGGRSHWGSSNAGSSGGFKRR